MKVWESQKSRCGSVMQCSGHQLQEAAPVPWAKGTQEGTGVIGAVEGSCLVGAGL